MKLTLHGHDDRYAVEQLQLSLFPDNTEGEAVSSLHRGKVWLTAVTKITVNGVTATATRRIKAADETVRLRRRALQQSYYLAAKQLLPVTPPWGALAGVRPTKITTKHLLEGGTPKSADELLRDVYYVTDDRRRLAIDCSVSTVRAVNMLQPSDLSLYVGIPFCPPAAPIAASSAAPSAGKRNCWNPICGRWNRKLRSRADFWRSPGELFAPSTSAAAPPRPSPPLRWSACCASSGTISICPGAWNSP